MQDCHWIMIFSSSPTPLDDSQSTLVLVVQNASCRGPILNEMLTFILCQGHQDPSMEGRFYRLSSFSILGQHWFQPLLVLWMYQPQVCQACSPTKLFNDPCDMNAFFQFSNTSLWFCFVLNGFALIVKGVSVGIFFNSMRWMTLLHEFIEASSLS